MFAVPKCLLLVFRFGGAALAVCCIRDTDMRFSACPYQRRERRYLPHWIYAESGFRVPLSRFGVFGIIFVAPIRPCGEGRVDAVALVHGVYGV